MGEAGGKGRCSSVCSHPAYPYRQWPTEEGEAVGPGEGCWRVAAPDDRPRQALLAPSAQWQGLHPHHMDGGLQVSGGSVAGLLLTAGGEKW